MKIREEVRRFYLIELSENEARNLRTLTNCRNEIFISLSNTTNLGHACILEIKTLVQSLHDDLCAVLRRIDPKERF